ncbi:unnamed protein product [Dicrocoelium dendriticum]|nr:unnamed protein product [Dicrocoelium dendriticum]
MPRSDADQVLTTVHCSSSVSAPSTFRSTKKSSIFSARFQSDNSSSVKELYWYHRQDGGRARRCRAPCIRHDSAASGKANSPYTSTTNVSVNNQANRLVYVNYQRSSIMFLIDTEAEVSLIPANANYKHSEPTYNLRTAKGSPIASFGRCMMNLDMNLRREFQWVIMVASFIFEIIGMDFLGHFGLLFDHGRHRLLDDCTKLEIAGIFTDAPIISPVFRIADVLSDYVNLLSEYPQLVRPAVELPPVTTEVAHPLSCVVPQRVLEQDDSRPTNNVLQVLQLCIKRPSNSLWASPLHHHHHH